MKSLDTGTIRSILVIKLRAVGDVILSTIVTKNLRLAFPDARIDFLTEKPSRDVLASNPFLNETIVYDRHAIGSGKLLLEVRRRSYDLVIDLFGNPRSAFVTFVSGARHRVGFRFRGRTYAYNHLVEPRGGSVHNTQFNLDALEAIGIPIRDRNLHVQFTPEDASYVDSFLSGAGSFLVGLSSGGGWYTKRWALDRFATLADTLIEKYGASVVLPWGPGQLEEITTITGLMQHPAIVPPATTLPQLGALLKRCSIVVSNDSGPMHLAAAVGTPVLGIYGPTSPLLQGPYGKQHETVRREGLDCLGCNFTRCPIGHPCMNELTLEMVMAGVDRLVKKNRIDPWREKQ